MDCSSLTSALNLNFSWSSSCNNLWELFVERSEVAIAILATGDMELIF